MIYLYEQNGEFITVIHPHNPKAMQAEEFGFLRDLNSISIFGFSLLRRKYKLRGWIGGDLMMGGKDREWLAMGRREELVLVE